MGVSTVAVLFTDLVDSTANAERLGPVAAEEQRREHFQALRYALLAHKGSEVKSTGDGLMVVFASPSDAVAGAAAMQVANSQLGSDGRTAPQMRTGVGFGETNEDGGDWFGMPVVRAARLSAAAKSGQILVDQFVAALADHATARFEPLGEVSLKGIAEPVQTLELLWASAEAQIPLPPALDTTSAPFVGRDQHLAVLRAAWDRASGGGTVLALLAGEPGAGKTSIAGALARALHGEGATVLFGRCDDGVGLAYQPFAQAVSHYVANATSAALETHVGRYGGELLRLAPHLGTRVTTAKPTVGDPAGEQWALFNAVHGLLVDAGSSSPVVLVLDDLHWASVPTLQLLRFLLKSESPARLLVVATYRDTELSRTHPLADTLAELRRLDAVERVHVDGLDLAETAALVEAVAGHALDEPGRALAGALHERTEGNPFFATEVLRHLAETGAIVFDGGRWQRGTEFDSVGLPEGVKEVVGRRLGRLDDDTNRALAVAAVAGLEFDAAVVAQVVGVELLAVLDALAPAVEAGIALELAQPNRYGFTHALIRTTIYEEAGASRLVQLHGLVADAIETVHAANLDPWLADLAYHHAEAAYPGRIDPAVEFARRAAAQARSLAAIEEAVGHLERGLDVARRNSPVNPRQVAELLIDLAEMVAVDEPERARDLANEATDIAAGAGHADLVARAAASMWSTFNTSTVGPLGGDSWLFDLCDRALLSSENIEPATYARLTAMRALMGGFTQDDVDLSSLPGAFEIALETNDPVTIVLAAQARWQTLDVPTAAAWDDYVDAVHAALETTDDHHLRGFAGIFLSWGASVMGDAPRFDLALGLVEAGRDALGGHRMRTWAAWMRAQAALRTGRWDEAIRATTEARDASVDPTIGELTWSTQAGTALLNQGRAADILPLVASAPPVVAPGALLAYRALVEALAGAHDAARESLGRTVDDQLLDREKTFLLAGAGAAAWAATVAGDTEHAPALEAYLRPYRGFISAGGMVEIGAVDRLIAMLAFLQGRYDEADELFRSGLALEENFGATALATNTRYWWARCLLDRSAEGDGDRAAALLTECAEAAEGLGMAQIAADARALL